MGTPFDFFSPKSWPSAASVTPRSSTANRALLAAAMRRRGFRPYDREWWHFTLRSEPFPDTYFDLSGAVRARRYSDPRLHCKSRSTGLKLSTQTLSTKPFFYVTGFARPGARQVALPPSRRGFDMSGKT